MSSNIVINIDDDANNNERISIQQQFKNLLKYIKICLFRLTVELSEQSNRSDLSVLKGSKRRVLSGKLYAFSLILLQTFQLLSFIFNATFDFKWGNASTRWWIDIINYTRIDLLIIGNNINDYVSIGISLTIILFIVFFFGGLCYYAYDLNIKYKDRNAENMYARPLYAPILLILLQLISGPLYIPVQSILLLHLRCRHHINGVCFNDSDIIFIIISLLISIILFLFLLFIRGTMFQSRSHSSHVLARTHGRDDIILIIIETLLVLSFSINSSNEFINILILSILILISMCILLWYQYKLLSFHHQWSNTLNCCATSIVLWASFLLVLSIIINDQQQRTYSLFFFIGSLFVILITQILIKERYEQIYSVTPNQLKDIFELEVRIQYIGTQLKELRLDIEFEDNINTKNVIKELENTIKLLIDMGIRRFGNYALMHMIKAQIYLDYFENDNVAQTSMVIASKKNPYFDVLYFVFKERSLIEDRIRSDSDGIKILEYIKVTNHYTDAQILVRKAAYLKYQFWSELNQNFPNIERLNDIGEKINYVVSKAYHHFREVLKKNRENSNILRAYSKFQEVYLNDHELAHTLLERANEIDIKKRRYNNQIIKENDLNDLSTLYDDKTGVVTISGSIERMGIIVNVNDGFCRLVGRSSAELLNHTINITMPTPFSELHDSLMLNHQTNGGGVVINRTREIFALHKNGWIFPIQIHVKQISGGLSESLYIGIIRQVRTGENQHAALVNTTTNLITRSTAGFAKFFEISLNDIIDELISPQKLLPDWIGWTPNSSEELNNYYHKDGRTIDHMTKHAICKLQITIQRVNFRKVSVDIIRINELSRKMKNSAHDHHNNNVFNTYDSINSPYTFDSDNDDDNMSEPPDISDILLDKYGSPNNANRPLHKIEENNNNSNDNEESKRSSKVKFMNIDENVNTNIELNERLRELAKQKQKLLMGTKSDWGLGLKRIRALFLKQSDVLEPAMKRLKYALIIVILGCIVMGTIVAILAINSMERYNNDSTIIAEASSRRDNIITISEATRRLELMRLGLIPTIKETWLRTRIANAAIGLSKIQTHLYMDEYLYHQHRYLYEYPTLSLKRYSSGIINIDIMNLLEAISKYSSNARSLVSDTLNMISTDNEKVYFIRANEEIILNAVNTSCFYYQDAAKADLSQITVYQTILLSITVIILICLVFILIIPAIARVEGMRKEIFAMFVNEIPLIMVDKIKERSFEYLDEDDRQLELLDQNENHNKLKEEKLARRRAELETLVRQQMLLQNQSNEVHGQQSIARRRQNIKLSDQQEQFIQSMIAEEEEKDRKQHKQKQKIRSKRHDNAFKFSNQHRYKLFIQIAILLVGAVSYFFSTYFWEQTIIDHAVTELPSLNYAEMLRSISRRSLYESRETFVYGVTTNDLYRPSHSIWLNKAKTDSLYLDQVLDALLYGSKEMQIIGSVSDENERLKMLFDDACYLFSNEIACRNFYYGIVQQGGIAMISVYRNLLSSFQYDNTSILYNTSWVKDRLISEKWKIIEELDEIYLDKLYDSVGSHFLNSEIEVINEYILMRKIFLTVFSLGLVVLYIIFYSPLVQKLDRTLKRTRGMLLLIPLEFISEAPAIASTLTNVANTNDK